MRMLQSTFEHRPEHSDVKNQKMNLYIWFFCESDLEQTPVILFFESKRWRRNNLTKVWAIPDRLRGLLRIARAEKSEGTLISSLTRIVSSVVRGVVHFCKTVHSQMNTKRGTHLDQFDDGSVEQQATSSSCQFRLARESIGGSFRI